MPLEVGEQGADTQKAKPSQQLATLSNLTVPQVFKRIINKFSFPDRASLVRISSAFSQVDF